MTNETLEEAAKKYSNIPVNTVIDTEERYFNSNVRDYDSFIEGAKWQAERSYSKKEVDDLLDRLLEGNMCSVVGEELIEKFKKA
jgi:hypothetical protein